MILHDYGYAGIDISNVLSYAYENSLSDTHEGIQHQ